MKLAPCTELGMVVSDSAVKQILLTMNDKENFIIEDLDDNHLVIKADEEFRVRKELEVEVSYCGCSSFTTVFTGRCP